MPTEPQLPWHRPCSQIAQTEGDSSSMGLYQASTGQGSRGWKELSLAWPPTRKAELFAFNALSFRGGRGEAGESLGGAGAQPNILPACP